VFALSTSSLVSFESKCARQSRACSNSRHRQPSTRHAWSAVRCVVELPTPRLNSPRAGSRAMRGRITHAGTCALGQYRRRRASVWRGFTSLQCGPGRWRTALRCPGSRPLGWSGPLRLYVARVPGAWAELPILPRRVSPAEIVKGWSRLGLLRSSTSSPWNRYRCSRNVAELLGVVDRRWRCQALDRSVGVLLHRDCSA
jgi:hypothetical protein